MAQLNVGDHVTAEWTWGGHRFQAAGVVTKVNGKTIKVRLTEDAGEHFTPGYIVTTQAHNVRKAGVREGHRVADFDMLHDLIEHAGATHMAVDKDNIANRLYVPKGKGYLELRVWMKEGFWHAQAPDRGKLINQLPRDASPIINRPSKGKSLWKRVVGAPRGRVEDYEAIDRRDRVIAGPFKHYSDAKDAAGPAGTVRFVPKGKKALEAPRGARRAPRAGAKEAGAAYAQDQIGSDHFMDWVREQMLEASKLPPDQVLPLETKADALKVARNMLQQLEWDTRRELRSDEIASLIGDGDVKEFWEGFREASVASREWLADELLEIKGGGGGGATEASRRAGEDRRRGYHGNKRDVPIRIGAAVMVINPDSMYRSEKGTVVELDARRAAKLDNFNRERVRKGAVLVERSNGSLFVVDSKDLAFYTQVRETRRPKAKRSVRRRR